MLDLAQLRDSFAIAAAGVAQDRAVPDRIEDRHPAGRSGRSMIVMSRSTYTYLEMFVARCLAMIGPFGIAIITARTLGPEGHGRYYYLVTLSTIGAQFASLGIHASNTYLTSKQRSLLPSVLTNSAWIAFVGGTAGACAAVAFDLVIES